MTKSNSILYLFLFLMSTFSFSQMKEYSYKQKINGIEKQWHHIHLSNSIYSTVDKNMADIRIYGITPTDTIEVPYILEQLKTETKSTNIPFSMRNKSHNLNGYFYTFTTKNPKEINQLHLNFDTENFDWKITLQARNKQKEWFTIVEDYRLVALKNNSVTYQFTDVVFPKSKYNKYRLLIKTDKDPKLTSAHFKYTATKKGHTRQYKIVNQSSNTHKVKKQTEVDIKLQEKVAINSLKVNIQNTTDYYRHYTLSYLSNRFKTEKGWIENYSTINSGVLSSLADNQINFETIFAKKLKLVIHNQDNAPLGILPFTCEGYVYQLTARFDKKESNYFLVNGRKNDRAPNYDIVRFTTQIPKNTSVLTLDDSLVIKKTEHAKTTPLFSNKIWLWAVMLIIIVILGWFSMKMMRDK